MKVGGQLYILTKSSKKIQIFMYFFLFLIIGCNDNSNTLNIELIDAKGLKEGAKVYCKNAEIGEVEEIFFVKQKLIAKLRIDEEFNVPKESKIYLISEDIFGTKAITIELSNNKDIYSEADTIVCIPNTETIIDSTIKNIDKVVNEIRDSLINK